MGVALKSLKSVCPNPSGVFSGSEILNDPNLLSFFGDAGMQDVAAADQANLKICSICFLSRASLSLASTPLCDFPPTS